MIQENVAWFQSKPGADQEQHYQSSKAYKDKLVAMGVLRRVVVVRNDLTKPDAGSDLVRFLQKKFGVGPENLLTITQDRETGVVTITLCDFPERMARWREAVNAYRPEGIGRGKESPNK